MPPTEDLLRHGGIEISRSHRAAGTLVEAPCGAGIALGNFLDDPDIGGRKKLGAANRARQQHAKEAVLDHRRDDRLRQFALPFDLRSGSGQLGNEGARPLKIFGAVILGCRGRHPSLLLLSSSSPLA
jgi:hypothetical protein